VPGAGVKDEAHALVCAHLVLDDALAASGAQVERPIGIQAHEHFGTGLGKGGVQRVVSGHAEACPLVPACSRRSDLTDWFNQTLRGTKQDLSAGYKKMANECGLSLQLDYWAPLIADMRANPSRHITADANYLGMLSGASAEQKKLAGIVCRGVLGMAVSGALGKEKDPSNRVILDFRNKTLARFVDESKSDKIYVTYGAAHLPGFFAELQKRDPKFEIRLLSPCASRAAARCGPDARPSPASARRPCRTPPRGPLRPPRRSCRRSASPGLAEST
jgi:hypothetical protein